MSTPAPTKISALKALNMFFEQPPTGSDRYIALVGGNGGKPTMAEWKDAGSEVRKELGPLAIEALNEQGLGPFELK